MFHDIPEGIKERMRELEAVDARDRVDGTPHASRLRQIPPETGRFIALLAACAPAGTLLEIGSSGGYSSLWLGLACRARGARLTTFEVSPEKARIAAETIRRTGMQAVVDLIEGDALKHLPSYRRVAFCFLDAEKELYQTCYDVVIPNLVPGGLFVADNAISHASQLGPMLSNAQADPRVDALVVPVGKGVLVCRSGARRSDRH